MRQNPWEMPEKRIHLKIGTHPHHATTSLSSSMCFKGVRLVTLGTNMSRHYSTEPKTTDSSHTLVPKNGAGEYELVYTAPLSRLFTIGLGLHMVGGSAVLVGVVFTPIYTICADLKSLSVLILCGSLYVTTKILTERYITQLHYNKSTEMVKILTTPIMLLDSFKLFQFKSPHRVCEFNISEATPAASDVFSSFEAKEQLYFIHTDTFQDKQLLSRLGVLHNQKHS